MTWGYDKTFWGPRTVDEEQARESFEMALRATEGRLKLVSAAAATGCWLLFTTLFALVFVLLDHWLGTGVPERARLAAAWAYWLFTAGWLSAALVWPLTRRLNRLYAARLIERAHPDFRNNLVDAVQISQHAELPGSVRAAVLARAALEVAKVNVRASVPTRHLGLVLSGWSVATALFLIYAAVTPKAIWPSLLRAFGSPRPAPTQTRIADLSPSDGTAVLRGTPVLFAASVSGQRPTTAFVRFSTDGGQSWIAGHQLPLASSTGGDESGLWQAIKPGQDVQQSMVWQLVTERVCSETRRLEVLPVPEITDIEVHYQYPGYTGLPPATQPGGAIDAPVGTKAIIRASANLPIRQAVLVTGQPPRERRRVLESPSPAAPNHITATLSVQHDDVYRIEYTDDRGNRNPQPISHVIRARPDSPPAVKIERPAQQTELLAEDTLDLVGSVQDDYGLTRVVLSYRRAAERSVDQLPLSLTSESGRTTGRLEQRVPLSQLNVKPGELIEWWVSAWDNRDGPRGEAAYQQADSEVRRILVRLPQVVAERSEEPPEEPPATAPSDENPRGTRGRGSQMGTGEDDEAGAVDASGSVQASADRPQGSGVARQPRSFDAREQFAEAHASELDALARHLPLNDAGVQSPSQSSASLQPAGQQTDQGASGSNGQTNGQGESPGQMEGSSAGQSERQDQKEDGEDSENEKGKQGGGSNQGEVESQVDGRAEGQGLGEEGDQNTGNDADQGDAESQGEGVGEVNGSGAGEGGEQGQQEVGISATARDQGGSGGQDRQPQMGQGGGASRTGGGGVGAAGKDTTSLPEEPAEADHQPTATKVPRLRSPQLQSVGRVDRLMDALDRALRAERVPTGLLDELGWDLSRAEQFVQEYQRVAEGLQPQIERTDVPEEVRTTPIGLGADQEAVRAAGPPAAGLGSLDTNVHVNPDATHDLTQAGPQRILPRYRPLLEAYYRSVSTRAAQ